MSDLCTDLNEAMNKRVEDMTDSQRQYICEALADAINEGVLAYKEQMALAIFSGKCVDSVEQIKIDTDTYEKACWKAHEYLERLLCGDNRFKVGDAVATNISAAQMWDGLYLRGTVMHAADSNGVIAVQRVFGIVPDEWEKLFSGDVVCMHHSYFQHFTGGEK